jgi:transporter family-2 protein
MKILSLVFLSIIAGAAIVLQSSLSGQLSKQINNSYFAALCLYGASFVIMILGLVFFRIPVPKADLIRDVPSHLWFLGSILSVIGLTLVYWLVPKLGISKVVSGIVFGQLTVGALASHWGWFNLPIVQIDRFKLIGFFLLSLGVVLINRGVQYE